MDSFDEMLELVGPYISKQDTVLRNAVSPPDRLSLTFWFLATWNTSKDLKFIVLLWLKKKY